MRILIDLDGIVCDTLDYWLSKIADASGVRAQVNDITKWELEQCPPLDKVDPKIIFGLLNSPTFMAYAPEMPGAVEALRLLNSRHKVYLLTARHGRNAMPETLDWVETHLPFLNWTRQVIFCHDKSLIPADVLIDDRAENLEKYKIQWGGSAHWIHHYPLCIGLAYPYNKQLQDDPAYHIEKDWAGILRVLGE